MPRASVFTLACFLFFTACQKIDPESSVPVLKQLENTSWDAEVQGTYRLEFKTAGRIKVRLGGVLGLAESTAVVKHQGTNFVLASLYEDTPNPFLISISILSSKNIKVYIQAYTVDLKAEDARSFLDENGTIFKRS